MKYQKVYEQGLMDGFSITNARTYLANGKPVVSMDLKTPYVSQTGTPITGHADVPVTHGKDLRDAYSVEFFNGGHNMDYINGMSGKLFENGPHGRTMVDMEDARTRMGQFAAAGSEYPHVEMFDDWNKLQEHNYKRLKLEGEPTEADYDKYLGHMERQLMSKDFTFVGEITSRKDLTKARQSVPSFGNMMTEMSQPQNDVQYE